MHAKWPSDGQLDRSYIRHLIASPGKQADIERSVHA
jgi:hypothetical protein